MSAVAPTLRPVSVSPISREQAIDTLPFAQRFTADDHGLLPKSRAEIDEALRKNGYDLASFRPSPPPPVCSVTSPAHDSRIVPFAERYVADDHGIHPRY